MPLHTDYRPTSLEQVVGNSEVVTGLKAHLQKKSPNRSLLFIGPSGCGKTTLAICMANELEAVDDNGWNFKLLNASDFRGIDTVREVREAAQRRPIGEAKARVWLFDEAHKITPDGQEAMLKLLEDPPRDCWFMLATTNPEKLKVTLRRRCTEFQVQPVSDREMSMLLSKVIRSETKKVPSDILKQICQESLGSPGIALNVLDKVIDLPEVEMSKAVKRFAARANNVITLCRAMMAEHRKKGTGWLEICKLLNDMEEEDPETIRRQVLEYMRKVMLSGTESAYAIMACFATPYYDTGRAGLVMSIYEAFSGN